MADIHDRIVKLAVEHGTKRLPDLPDGNPLVVNKEMFDELKAECRKDKSHLLFNLTKDQIEFIEQEEIRAIFVRGYLVVSGKVKVWA